MGLATPYLEVLPPPEEPNGDWSFIPIDSDAPMIVNGQRVTCSLDGMAIGCAQAQRAMDSGSAIPAALAPYQHLPGFNFESRGMGIYTVELPRQVGWHVTYGPNDTRGTARPVYSGTTTHSFSVNWSISVSVEGEPSTNESAQSNQALIDQAIADARNILSNSNACSRFFGFWLPVHERTMDRTDEIIDYRNTTEGTEIANALGGQLRIGLINGDMNNRTTGIRMNNTRTNLGTTVHSGEITYRMFAEATVNSRGPFLSTGRFGDYNGRAGRALAILHEIAHMIRTGVVRDTNGRVTGYTHLIPDDGPGAGGSTNNTETIQEKCRGELEALENADD